LVDGEIEGGGLVDGEMEDDGLALNGFWGVLGLHDPLLQRSQSLKDSGILEIPVVNEPTGTTLSVRNDWRTPNISL
jgi:hypothetical protein